MSETADDIYKRLNPKRRRLTADGTAAEAEKPPAKPPATKKAAE